MRKYKASKQIQRIISNYISVLVQFTFLYDLDFFANSCLVHNFFYLIFTALSGDHFQWMEEMDKEVSRWVC